MHHSFDINSYLKHVAEDLITDFTIAGHGTTPGLVGSAREKATRRKLETLLPPLVGVGTGCVIDSYGNTSRQMDIILYEKLLCLVFSINDTPETTYYPCEGVIAVGEIKSSLTSADLEDIFVKILSVKNLRRHVRPEKSILFDEEIVNFRHYGNTTGMAAAKVEEFNQRQKLTDQIFCFAFCGELGARPETILDKFDELRQNVPREDLVNLIAILNYGLLLYLNKEKKQIRYWFGDDADCIYLRAKREGNFEFLLNRLTEVFRNYRTAELSAFSNYIMASAGKVYLNGVFKDLQ